MPAYRFGPFELRPASRELLVEGRPASLGARAFDVLLALLERRDRLVTKDEMLAIAWPGLVVEENNLQVQISALRKILGDGVIKKVSGRGAATKRWQRHSRSRRRVSACGHGRSSTTPRAAAPNRKRRSRS